MNTDTKLSRRGFIVKSISVLSTVYFIPDLITPVQATKPLNEEVK